MFVILHHVAAARRFFFIRNFNFNLSLRMCLWGFKREYEGQNHTGNEINQPVQGMAGGVNVNIAEIESCSSQQRERKFHFITEYFMRYSEEEIRWRRRRSGRRCLIQLLGYKLGLSLNLTIVFLVIYVISFGVCM
jgi:hypothetical protein